MTIISAISLFFIMMTLAAVPSASVALVVTRSATLGFKNGAAVALGIVLGDLVFIALAILGMSFLAETLGSFFAVIKYAGGAYLIWTGISLFRSKPSFKLNEDRTSGLSLLTSFAAGFFLTLGDIKAIVFYASLFPAFVDLSSLTAFDIGLIAGITLIAVGGVKLTYAFAAGFIVERMSSPSAQSFTRKAAGGLLVGSGAYLISKA